MLRLKQLYEEKVKVKLISEGYKNNMAVPKISKVVVNVGIGKTRVNSAAVEQIKKNLAAITGQKPAIRKSRKAISGFKVRTGDEVGLMVTLRGDRMYDFLEKLINITLPRIRDFRGLNPKSFDGNGNFTLGMTENIYFPEVSQVTENIHGLEITVVTTAKNKDEGLKLLKELGFPFKGSNNPEEKNG